LNKSLTKKGLGKSKNTFIAAQGPTQETVFDFLRMIYEHKVKAVVMLTKIFEEEPPVMKCWPYWNDRMPVHFDCLSLEVKSIQNYLFYEKRNIEIKYMVCNYNLS
jgi:protein tyrosine phosphatase